ncbi:F0F1 ATP synthase subunit epsilon [Chachezhania sediminis]|uniref:F0F1 ATP synthase subunit epsilon n=1 Tax=Chachezhania sediminis TaxID=2599291 RepID=UPI00131D6565|nr:F0F1 ATP synthase subunit epsilon [Chachezhania sediminis]
MTGALHLRITTPMAALIDAADVRAVRAEDDSGAFGILPGHIDFLTALPASVVRWRDAGDRLHFCAVRAGVLTVLGGTKVSISCREGVLGDDLDGLVAKVADLRAAQVDADRSARTEEARLHSRAVRQIMRYLRPDRPGAFDHPPLILGEGGDG